MQMVASFGARLRAERERRKVTLRGIAEDTKIKASLLEGLEQDDLSYWPEGLFRRAYVRAYARAVGLDPERIVHEFLEHYPEPVEADPAEAVTPARSLLTSPIATVSGLLRRGSRSEAPPPAASPATTLFSGPVPSFSSRPVSSFSSRPAPSVREFSDLCTNFGRLPDRRGLPPLLADAVRVLDAIGLVVWVWDACAASLKATLANGYSDEAIAQLPDVPATAPNAVAEAFRSREACVIPGETGLTGAVAVPMIGPAGCLGVLAVEVHSDCEHLDSIRAFAVILAAQLVGLAGPVALAEAVA
jgi:transcriptional regulator with XRE-family HTH domain